jgi:hypothetical protein
MSSTEFVEWAVFDQMNPMGPERYDWLAAAIMAVIANAHKTKGRVLTPKDFLPKWKVPLNLKQAKPWQAIKMKLMAWVGPHNKRVEEEERRRKHGDSSGRACRQVKR